ncbi:hypothetical protein BDQ17DRAFT_1351826 [Cyathus striatus]|nr:hypothetical protein BDQ17DRAFT_1351826 [Cyathus striatus]
MRTLATRGPCRISWPCKRYKYAIVLCLLPASCSVLSTPSCHVLVLNRAISPMQTGYHMPVMPVMPSLAPLSSLLSIPQCATLRVPSSKPLTLAQCAKSFPTTDVPMSEKPVEIEPPILALMSCISRTPKSNRLMAVGTARCVLALAPFTRPIVTASHQQWALTNPSSKQSGYYNPGWPGCCRPPVPAEYRLIQPADWRSVSIVHHVPIPPDIKAALDSLSIRASPIPPSSSGSVRGSAVGKSPMPSFDRRNSGNSSPSSRSNSLSAAKTSGMTIPTKSRSGGSPKQTNAALGATIPRAGSGHSISTSVTNSATLQHHSPRRQPIPEFTDKPVQGGTHSSHSSPNRKHMDLDVNSTPRRVSSMKRSSASPSASASTNGTERRSPESQQHVRRRSSISHPPPTPPPAKASVSTLSPANKDKGAMSLAIDRPKSLVIPRSSVKDEDSLSSASSSSGSSDGLGSLSDSTVTSDGGFTDYLSDESEAELQRQAEAKAALLAQNQAEEMEFKAARQQLAHIDLRPPKTWNPTNITNSTASRHSAAHTPACPPVRAVVPTSFYTQAKT